MAKLLGRKEKEGQKAKEEKAESPAENGKGEQD